MQNDQEFQEAITFWAMINQTWPDIEQEFLTADAEQD